MKGRIRRFVQDHDLLRGTVAACVSGGPDSMALLHLLVELGHRPRVRTFDHGLRPESQDECRLVVRVATELDCPVEVVRLNVEPGPDLAARARAARLAHLPDGDSVALGHHADDQAETVLDRLTRGSGARGLAAMRPRTGRVVRPLLCVTRAELHAWLGDRPHVVDPSNAEGNRARLRHLLAELVEVRPGATRGLARSAGHLGEDDAFLEALAQDRMRADGVDTDGPAPLVRRALLAHVRQARGHAEIHSRALDAAIRLVEGAGVDIGGGWRLVRRRGIVRCERGSGTSPTSARDDVDPVST